MSTDPLAFVQVPLDHPDGVPLITEVQDYYQSIYGGPDSSPIDSAEFAPPHGRFFIAYRNSRAVAMGGWRFHHGTVDIPRSRPAEIKRMYVVRSARRQGLARAMLTQLEDTAKAAGADAMVLETGYVQQEAITLYRASGYVDVPRFGHYAGVEGAIHLGKLW